jgi:hypothetical protein
MTVRCQAATFLAIFCRVAPKNGYCHSLRRPKPEKSGKLASYGRKPRSPKQAGNVCIPLPQKIMMLRADNIGKGTQDKRTIPIECSLAEFKTFRVGKWAPASPEQISTLASFFYWKNQCLERRWPVEDIHFVQTADRFCSCKTGNEVLVAGKRDTVPCKEPPDWLWNRHENRVCI